MTTKDSCQFLKNKNKSFGISHTYTDDQHSDLNLNQNLKCSIVSPIHSNIKSSHFKNKYGNQNCCSPDLKN
jgi:hypothetical protein